MTINTRLAAAGDAHAALQRRQAAKRPATAAASSAAITSESSSCKGGDNNDKGGSTGAAAHVSPASWHSADSLAFCALLALTGLLIALCTHDFAVAHYTRASYWLAALLGVPGALLRWQLSKLNCLPRGALLTLSIILPPTATPCIICSMYVEIVVRVDRSLLRPIVPLCALMQIFGWYQRMLSCIATRGVDLQACSHSRHSTQAFSVHASTNMPMALPCASLALCRVSL